MQPGPTQYEAEQLRKKRGSQGLLGAIGEPMSYSPNPLVNALGSGLLGAQYLTGEKPLDEGLSALAMMTGLLQGTKVAPIIRNIAKLKTDNPGGEWLRDKKDYSNKYGHNEFGARKTFGSITGTFEDNVDIPIDVAAQIKGLRGEQQNVRKSDLEWLIKHMKETGKFPEYRKGEQYVPYIEVDQDGIPWVNEGNHRIMAAKALGWKSIPAEVRYFNGGESVSGVLSPEKLKEYERLLQQIR